jgi:flagellar biosynthetic protein FliO
MGISMDDGLNFGLQFAKMAGGLAVVLAALLACAYGLKKTGLWLRKPESESWIHILAQQTIGMKHQVVLLKVRDQTLLVGISPQGINLLTHIEGVAEPASTVGQPLTEEPR